jgi:hypothetical protein
MLAVLTESHSKMLNFAERRRIQFCALDYRPQGADGTSSSHDAKVIIFLLRLRNGHLRLFVHPDWRSMVCPEDLDYIGDIVSDFKRRIRQDSGALFEQAKSLAVGPLVTHSEGISLAEHPALLELSSTFLELLPQRRSSCRSAE